MGVELEQGPEPVQYICTLIIGQIKLVLAELKVVGLILGENVQGIVIDTLWLKRILRPKVPRKKVHHVIFDLKGGPNIDQIARLQDVVLETDMVYFHFVWLCVQILVFASCINRIDRNLFESALRGYRRRVNRLVFLICLAFVV